MLSNPFEILHESFTFDLWANQKWLAYLESQSGLEIERGIFQHIFSGQEVWLQRVFGNALTAMPKFEVTIEKITELNNAWKGLLASRSDNPIIHYHRFDGVAGHLHLDQIARHLIDHGTYHRGELRGLCRVRGAEDFPETGLGLYYMNH